MLEKVYFIVSVLCIIIGAVSVFTDIGSPRQPNEITIGYILFAAGIVGVLIFCGYKIRNFIHNSIRSAIRSRKSLKLKIPGYHAPN